MEKLDARIVEWMNAHRTDADTWILPPGPTTYLRLVPVEKTHYDIAGPEGPARVNGIVSAGRPHEANDPSKRLQDIVEPYGLFKKNKVYISRSYDVDQTGPIDLLSRMSSVGEYFKARFFPTSSLPFPPAHDVFRVVRSSTWTTSARTARAT